MGSTIDSDATRFGRHVARQRPDEESTKEDLSHGVELAARIGYAAKGFVYATIGVLALMTVFGYAGGRLTGTEGAIESLRSQPFGQILLWAIGIGLIGYVVWRLTEAVMDPEHNGSDAKGILKRVGFFIVAVSYTSLAVFTIRAAMGSSSSGDGGSNSTQQSTQTIMQYDWGLYLIGLVGLVFIGIAFYQGYRAYTAKFLKKWKTGQMNSESVKWATIVSQVGIAARALAFLLIGWFFLQAAIQADPSEAQGLEGALRTFREQPYGTVWLAAVGFGFVCYGAYCAINARFKHIDPSS